MKEEITINNEINEISRVAEYIESIGETLNLSFSDILNINLAIEEALANVIMYAYPEQEKGQIFLSTSYKDNELTFIITDKGKSFDPTKVESADISAPAEERSIGGLGIFLIKKIMDEVSYQRIEDANQLTMKKKIEPTQ